MEQIVFGHLGWYMDGNSLTLGVGNTLLHDVFKPFVNKDVHILFYVSSHRRTLDDLQLNRFEDVLSGELNGIVSIENSVTCSGVSFNLTLHAYIGKYLTFFIYSM